MTFHDSKTLKKENSETFKFRNKKGTLAEIKKKVTHTVVLSKSNIQTDKSTDYLKVPFTDT